MWEGDEACGRGIGGLVKSRWKCTFLGSVGRKMMEVTDTMVAIVKIFVNEYEESMTSIAINNPQHLLLFLIPQGETGTPRPQPQPWLRSTDNIMGPSGFSSVMAGGRAA